MYSNKFVICDRDEKYLQRLQDYLIKKRISNFEILVFTDLESVIKHNSYEPYEIILVGENVCNDKMQKITANHKFILMESDIRYNTDYPAISKYQSADRLLAELFENIAKEDCEKKEVVSDNRLQYGSSHTRIITYYSPLNHVAQSGMALDTAIKHSMQGHKVLYINLTAFSSMDNLLSSDSDTDVIDYMYFALLHTDKAIYKLENIKKTYNGVDYLPPAHDYQDIMKITKEEWVKGLNILFYSTDYDEIILDISEICQALSKVLEKSEVIYMIASNDRDSKAKMNQYIEYMTRKSQNAIFEKTRYIYLNGEMYNDQIRTM